MNRRQGMRTEATHRAPHTEEEAHNRKAAELLHHSTEIHRQVSIMQVHLEIATLQEEADLEDLLTEGKQTDYLIPINY